VHGLRFVGQVPGYISGLAQARIGFAVLGALAAAGASLLAARLFGVGPAVLAGLGLAAEPFLVVNQQLVHVDGPLTAFVTLAALLALARWTAAPVAGRCCSAARRPGWHSSPNRPPSTCSGSCAGGRGRSGAPLVPTRTTGSIWQAARRPIGDLIVWGVVGCDVRLLWPALWVLGPVEVFSRVIAFTRETGGQPDEVGSYFLGQVGSDPGPLYYPVATLFRLSPYTTLGLVVLAALGWRLTSPARMRVLWLLVFVGGFSLMMTLGPKKFDRYLLPIYPALVILASLGWWTVLRWLDRRVVQVAVGAVLVVGLVWPLASTYPYPLSFYNPLLGGGAVAQRA